MQYTYADSKKSKVSNRNIPDVVKYEISLKK